MSKGRSRRAWAAQAMRKRNPESWFIGPVAVQKTSQKNRLLVKLPKVRGGRGE
jgi:hypothetical protein